MVHASPRFGFFTLEEWQANFATDYSPRHFVSTGYPHFDGFGCFGRWLGDSMVHTGRLPLLAASVREDFGVLGA